MDLCLCFLIHWVCHSFPSKEQASLNFMPAATISNDFEAPKIKICHSFQFFPYLPWSDGNRCLRFLNVEFQTSFFQSSLSPSSQGSLVLLCFLPGGIICISEAIDISPGNLDSSLCFIQPGILHDVLCIEIKKAGWQYTALLYSFPNLEPVHRSMSSSNCCLLTCIQVSQEAGQVAWYSHLFQNFPQFVVIHTVKGFSIINEAEVDIFLEFPWFFYDPTNVGSLISGSSAFSKSSLYIWKFSVHVLLKPVLKDFEHNLVSMWYEPNYVVVWTFFGIALLWNKNENWLF